jgi:hypothetical protein
MRSDRLNIGFMRARTCISLDNIFLKPDRFYETSVTQFTEKYNIEKEFVKQNEDGHTVAEFTTWPANQL